MKWMDFNRDGEVDATESLFAEEIMRVALFLDRVKLLML